MDLNWFSLPQSATGKEFPIGYDEAGNPVRRSRLGATYTAKPQASPEAESKRALIDQMIKGQAQSPLYSLEQARIDAQRGAAPTGREMASSLVQGALQGVEAPGRAAAGEPVTHGDAWATALDYGAMAAPVPKPAGALGAGGIRAYHGSPHSFDKFSKVARKYGVGDQAFGDAHYFADTEKAAQGYLERVKKPNINGGSIYSSGLSDDAQELVWKYTQDNQTGSLADVAARARDDLTQRQGDMPYSAVRRYNEIIDELAAQGDSKITVPGNMYEVNINANQEDFLNWDGPDPQNPEITAGDRFRTREAIVGRKNATQEVADKGYPGIVYDVGRGENMRKDYAVFDENLIEIVRKYGIAGAAALTGMTAAEIEAGMGQAQAGPSAATIESYLAGL